ncbi:MAG: tyrosine-type recombinase/integrase [Bacteroidota bacterium]|nr:tyrosine-type recombinase/integrase [Bacteroidota bacterium]
MYLTKRNKIYHLFYTDMYGKSKSVSTKCEKKSEALKFLNNFSIEESQKQKLKRISYNDYKQEYIEIVKNIVRPSYLENIRIAFKQFDKVITKDMPLDEISTAEIHKFIALKLAEPVGERVVNGYLRALQAAFSKAIELNRLKENPFSRIKKLKPVKNPPIFPSSEELKLIIDAEKDLQMKILYEFAFFTGMRLSEIRFLRWKSIDFHLKFISIENHEEFTTKSKQARKIPLYKNLGESLLKIKPKEVDEKQYVFTHKGLPMTKNHISKAFKTAVRACTDKDGKPNVNQKLHFHSLRHGHASHLAMKAVPLAGIRDLLGHQSITTTEIYSHLYQSYLSEAIDKLPEIK